MSYSFDNGKNDTDTWKVVLTLAPWIGLIMFLVVTPKEPNGGILLRLL